MPNTVGSPSANGMISFAGLEGRIMPSTTSRMGLQVALTVVGGGGKRMKKHIRQRERKKKEKKSQSCCSEDGMVVVTDRTYSTVRVGYST